MTDGRSKQKQCRNWCFTVNNPTVDGPAYLQRFDDRTTKYAILQLERGESGTAHFQGYLELARSQRFNYVKKLLGKEAHIEPRAGTADQARNYCRKDDGRVAGPFEFGTFTAKKPGNRSDLQDAAATLVDTRSLRKVADQHPTTYIRYSKGLSAYLRVTARRREQAPTVYLYFGTTGSGKTRKAIEENTDYYRKHPDSKWFDGYTNQECLLLDDFSGSSSKMSLNYVLQLIDRYPFSLEIKGDYTELLATKIIITTNHHPNQWYDYSKRAEQYLALARRIHHVHVFDSKGNFEVDHGEFFGKTPYQTPDDYRKIIKKPELQRQNAFLDLSTLEDSYELSLDSEIEEDSSSGDEDGNLIQEEPSNDSESDDPDFVRPKKRKRIDYTTPKKTNTNKKKQTQLKF